MIKHLVRSSIMAITNLNTFLQNYFTSHHCEFLQNNDGLLTVQLTEKMDRALMNRPFYWHYVKSTGHPGEPMRLTFITNPDKREEKGEWIHFGSPRLQQIMKHLKQNEKYTKLFQCVDKGNTSTNTALYPWLVCNIKISYQGKQKRDEIISIGLHLMNGRMQLEMMEHLQKVSLQMTISDYCYTISPMIRIDSGYRRIEKVVKNYFQNQSQEWADESLETLQSELQTLKHFYIEREDDEQMKKEINEITERYNPCITYEVINGGIFYLTENFLDTLEQK